MNVPIIYYDILTPYIIIYHDMTVCSLPPGVITSLLVTVHIHILTDDQRTNTDTRHSTTIIQHLKNFIVLCRMNKCPFINDVGCCEIFHTCYIIW